MSDKQSYMIDDSELADISVRWESGELTEVNRSRMKGGDETLRVTDGYWVYVVRVTSSGDWIWGFKYEA